MTKKQQASVLLIFLFAVFILINTPLVWKWMYPIKYEQEILTAAKQYQVSPYLILAIIRSESAFDYDRVSKKGAVGLMQVMPDTAQWVIEQANLAKNEQVPLTEPGLNISIGTWYMAFLLERFDGDLVKAVAAYNAGPSNVNAWLEKSQWDGTIERVQDIPVGETRHYVQRVFYFQDRYQKIYSDLLQ
ncbi:lytic transglycosylase domain-containing protein [Brevibacillus fulvus]|uniref:Soluble lytic murein transglycosylase n=1 Tax=Brevibacillus fulvus TaxID=1125967 RepID=A0A939BQJ7_9BACL|nr:lytic transglycosylase domain-containing protein [Brevibacillus fulvus]MBM7591705.1 soluble lytic murein transglycosylase [Brevibacillus fulvus]